MCDAPRAADASHTLAEMHPTIDFDFFEIPVYTALIILGILVGVAVTFVYLRRSLRRAASLKNFLDGALVVFIASWIGARAYHVAAHWDYYVARPEEITQIGLGGMAMRGALMAGLVALALFARWRRIDFAKLADATAIGLAMGQAIGWAGALAQGANYGVVSESQIAMELPDLYGLVAPRFPLQHAEIILFAGLAIGLLLLASSYPRPGILFLAFILGASVVNFGLGFQRGDETLVLGGLRIDQWVDASAALLALLFWLKLKHEGNVGISR